MTQLRLEGRPAGRPSRMRVVALTFPGAPLRLREFSRDCAPPATSQCPGSRHLDVSVGPRERRRQTLYGRGPQIGFGPPARADGSVAIATRAASPGSTPSRVNRRMSCRRCTSLGVYLRWEPAECPVGPRPYRRSQVRSVAGATPSRRASAATVRTACCSSDRSAALTPP